jgi:CYTH domain
MERPTSSASSVAPNASMTPNRERKSRSILGSFRSLFFGFDARRGLKGVSQRVILLSDDDDAANCAFWIRLSHPPHVSEYLTDDLFLASLPSAPYVMKSSSNCHRTKMSDTDARTPARERARAVAGLNGDLAPQGQEKTDNSAASATEQGLAKPRSQEPAIEGIPLHEASPGSKAAASEVSLPSGAAQLDSELELKLLVDNDRLSDFNDAPIIATSARNKGTRKHLKALYYDTPERTLWRNGLSLRVRQSGARFVQTVKAEFGNDPLRRGEWEASVTSIAPDVALAMPFIPAKLRANLECQQLEAVFSADIHRYQRIIDLPSGTVEVAFDHGLLKSGDRSMPVSEIELELKGGSPSAIYELAHRFAEHGSLRPSIRSKAARGFDLAADIPPAVRKPRKLRLDPSIPLDDAFATILRSCLHHLLESLPAAEDGHERSPVSTSWDRSQRNAGQPPTARYGSLWLTGDAHRRRHQDRGPERHVGHLC